MNFIAIVSLTEINLIKNPSRPAMTEIANKRIPVTEEIWESLADMKKHGQTYDQLLAEMIALKQERDFLAHIEDIEKHGEFVSLKDAAKLLNIPESG